VGVTRFSQLRVPLTDPLTATRSIALLTTGAAMVPLCLPHEMQQLWAIYLALTGVVLALMLPLVSIMTLTSEWGQRSVLVTFNQEPRRTRVIAAKVLSGLALAILGSGFAFAISAGALAVSDVLGRSVAWAVDGKDIAGFTLFVSVNSLMGMVFGALLLNTPAAIVLFLVLPTLWTLLAFGWLENLGRSLDTAQTYRYILESDWDGHRPDPGLARGLGRNPTSARHRAHPPPRGLLTLTRPRRSAPRPPRRDSDCRSECYGPRRRPHSGYPFGESNAHSCNAYGRVLAS
jgi:ABC-2 type transport system permease protein